MVNDNIWKDILNWETDIHKKDEELLRRKPVHNQALPPVRKSTEIMLDNLKPVGIDTLSNTKKTTTSNTTPKTRAEKAEAEKAKGNDYFVKKDYKNAILYYGKAIDLDPTVPVYFVNRAMAYLKTNRFLEAEKDCSRGIQLQPKNVKALWRRGIALRELGRINEARKDFETGLTIEPNNKSLLDELKKLPAAKPIEKSRLKKPEPVEEKRRLSINVIDDSYTKSKETVQPKSQKLEPTTNKTTNVKKVKPSAIQPITSKKAEPTNSKPEPVQKVGQAIIESTPVKKEAKLTTETTQKPAVPVAPSRFTCPRTNFEFERDWKTYKGRGEDILYQYFQAIPPKEYATIFKSSLESDQFEKMIEMVDAKYTKEKSAIDIYNVIEGLSQVKRIDMLIMFLDKKHQQVLQRLFDVLKSASEEVPKETLEKLSKVYGTKL